MGLLIEANGRLTRALGAELEARLRPPLTWYDVLHPARPVARAAGSP